ncbi:AtzH-like domain-containing protein [Terracidiphilus sp.]|jgi:Protein of unknown function (DUF3225)|uniref:AtzH-like domain-containing protein n=1 Tax=Terracidiphilus sp. TaxID=1964191 RepID=UPI003C1D3410
MTINDPSVIAELKALYPQYEEALVTNDIETLIALFWHSPQVIRFGVTENLHGIAEIEAFRKSRPAANLTRTITRQDIVSFGRDFASITLEFERSTQTAPSVAANPRPGSAFLKAGASSPRTFLYCHKEPRKESM